MNEGPRPPLGRGLLSGGYVLVSLGLGIAFGYWASDWEMRFFPTVVIAILVLMTAGLGLFAMGAQLEREEKDRRKLGRRAAASAAFALAALAAIGAVALSSRPTALTTMADSDLRRTHELDARYFRELDRTLRGLVARMESRRDLFSAGEARLPTDEEEALLLDVWTSYLDTAMALDDLRRFHEDFYRFDLSRMERSRHVKSFLLTFGSELSLYQSTAEILSLLGSNETLASRFDSDPEVRAWVGRVSGREIPFSLYLEETYPLAWKRRAIADPDEPPLTVVEAVSEGVIQNSLHGASGDFIAALRPRLSPLAKAQAIFKAFSFLDRPYDFDFDFATDHALVCTEVVWRAYRASGEGLPLELRPIAGRLTLPANEIARSFVEDLTREDRRFDFVYYLEGREREQKAAVTGVESFAATVERSKWDFGNE